MALQARGCCPTAKVSRQSAVQQRLQVRAAGLKCGRNTHAPVCAGKEDNAQWMAHSSWGENSRRATSSLPLPAVPASQTPRPHLNGPVALMHRDTQPAGQALQLRHPSCHVACCAATGATSGCCPFLFI